MLFKSKFALFTQVVRHEINIPHPTLPTFIGKINRLAAEFGQPGSEFQYTDAEGNTKTGVEIRGYYFDSEIAQELHGWTDEEREEVELSLIKLSGRWPDACTVIDKPKAKLPWPKYNETHFSKIVELADSLGLVQEALAFERENKNRESVVKGLSDKLVEASPPVADDEELAVA